MGLHNQTTRILPHTDNYTHIYIYIYGLDLAARLKLFVLNIIYVVNWHAFRGYCVRIACNIESIPIPSHMYICLSNSNPKHSN